VIQMDLIECMDSSTHTSIFNEPNTTITNFNTPVECHVTQINTESPCAYWVKEPYNALITFDKAKDLYTLKLIQNLKLVGQNPSIPRFISKNLAWLDMASHHLIESGDKYRESLAEESRLMEEFLSDDFVIEMPPLEEFEIKAKVIFDEGEPDLSGLEEF
jgi:hypothetical protein